MTGPEEGGLPPVEELTSPEREIDPEDLHAGMLHMTGLADRRPAQRREDLPDTAALREQLGV